MQESVYIVIRQNPDIKNHMVEIMGVFKNEVEAQKRRQEIWDRKEILTQVQSYFVLDTLDWENNAKV